ncbi:hypothetical protein [Brevibacillus porteri]|uniref:Uncharacterized protein n=1 Tax=Brevibacillus porteri TaxID=2126350 RepID=A0ABX5FS39_9BACL|nr:hypothetical protein [Brevibacillus porteri]MED1801856.1 hypothetical protein [Brevibacillus porteri]MED2134989.1 hypothetical protein [Brevibacillus porteri]MED2745509.1 hypothetical protein [Brevibacillus porteri]MED2815746.1 hypothetical protein [Brevibacillus porteri]MED2897583.1 hypothetical protein [Brevibacillus porteri]
MSSSRQVGMFIYPWDIAESGIEAVIQTLEGAKCNTAVVNSSYHQGRFFHPQSKTFRRLPLSGVSFTPEWSKYNRLRPTVHEQIAQASVLAKMKEACERAGMGFHTWWVGLHNSTLGLAHPDLCVQNIWGDTYTYALCPSQPEVQHYAKALFADTLEQVKPERILIEATAFLPMKHGEHHEVCLLPLGESLQWLLSFCFCGACTQRAEAKRIDVGAVQQLVSRLVNQMVEADSISQVSVETREVAFLLLEYPELYHYQQTRLEVVDGLWRSLKDIALSKGTALDGFPSSTPFYVNQSYWEGVSLRKAAATLDRVVPLAYGDSVNEVAYTFHAMKLVAPEAALGAAFSLHHSQIQSAFDLAARVGTAVDAGAQSITYYNLGLLNNRRLNWIRQANLTIEE